MKKIYSKPRIYFEAFQLDATIAASCSSQGYITINHGENDCTYQGQYFNYDNCNIDLTGPEDGNDTVCYHGPGIAHGDTFISS